MTRKRTSGQLQIVNPHCAGIDVGKTRHYAAVDPDSNDEPVRNFGTFTDRGGPVSSDRKAQFYKWIGARRLSSQGQRLQ